MLWLSFLLLSSLRIANALPSRYRILEENSNGRIVLRNADPSFHKTELKVADHVLDLKRVGVKPDSSKALLRELASGTKTESFNAVQSGGGYAVEMSLGGKTFDIVFDTGSSDLWVFHEGVKCYSSKGNRKPDSVCDFGPEYSGTFEDGSIKNENFLIQYADGEFLVGTLGYEDVEVAGVTIDKQEMALVDDAYWVGDGKASGILGMAYSSLTSAYTGTNASNDNPNTNNVHYKNFLSNAISQKKIDPIFSVALERGSSGGYGQVALGGLPSISFDHSFASTPIQKLQIRANDTIEKTQYSYYTIVPDGFVLNGKSTTTTVPGIVDTGTTLLYLPPSIAKEINDAFKPPSVYVASEGVYENDCTATPPDFAIKIGGKDFTISNHELLLHGALGYDAATKGCVTGIQPGPAKYAILGDIFLKNVVAVFDVGGNQMKFAPHVNY